MIIIIIIIIITITILKQNFFCKFFLSFEFMSRLSLWEFAEEEAALPYLPRSYAIYYTCVVTHFSRQ